MEGLLDWGAEIVRALEGLRPTFDGWFRFLTLLGEDAFFFALLAALYWVVDRDLAVRMTVLLAASIFTNAWLKDFLAQPRPPDHDPTLTPLIDIASHGLPSGHAQSAVIIWGSLFAAFRRRWVRITCVAALMLVPFSRLYLGVHFPHDLVGGYAVGAALLWADLRFGPALVRWFFSRPLPAQVTLAVGLPAIGTALVYSPGGARGGGAVAGGLLGLVVARRWIESRPPATMPDRLRRLVVGYGGVMGLWIVSLPFDGPIPATAAYCVIAFWIGAGAPWVFTQIEPRRAGSRP